MDAGGGAAANLRNARETRDLSLSSFKPRVRGFGFVAGSRKLMLNSFPEDAAYKSVLNVVLILCTEELWYSNLSLNSCLVLGL